MNVLSIFDILQGPNCNQDMAWYRVRTPSGIEGWIAEGDVSYFVDPVGSASPTRQPPQNTIVLGPACTVILEDSFENGFTANDWFIDERTGLQSRERVIDDFYEISLNFIPAGEDEATSWGTIRGPAMQNLRDARVEAAILVDNFSAPGARTGLWLRYQNEREFLAFMISSTGSYRIARYQNGYSDIVNWTTSNAIRIGDGETNTLRVDMRGDDFDLFINGRFITTVSDSTWPSGRIAFWGSSSILPNRFLLDYFRVCQN
jgi:hypothetical protein